MAILFGALAGFAVSDVLRAEGLGWLNWPVVALLLGVAAGITVSKRYNRRS